MEKIDDIPIIKHVYDECKQVASTIVVIPFNDPVTEYLRKEFIPYYEGAKEDVLARYYICAKTYKIPRITRITADCPLLDMGIITLVRHFGNNSDFCSNVIERTYPDGLDVETFSFKALEWLHNNATGDDREHVTSYFYSHKKEFLEKVGNYTSVKKKYNDSNLKLSVDSKEDLERVREAYRLAKEA